MLQRCRVLPARAAILAAPALALLVVVTIVLAGRAPVSTANAQERNGPAADLAAASPVLFVENAGQWPEAARFQVWGGQAAMWLSEDGIWFVIGGQTRGAENRKTGEESGTLQEWQTRGEQRRAAIRLSFVNANPHATLEGIDRSATRVSYFLGNDPARWRPEAPVWQGVRYRDIYPGVDLEMDGSAWRLTAAGPGLATAPVRVRVEGGRAARWHDGQVVVATEAGELAIPPLDAPVAYTAEVLNPNGLATTFDVMPGRDWEPAQPAGGPGRAPDNPFGLVYSTFLGGSGGDTAGGIAIDTQGRATIAGFTDSGNFPTVPGSFDTSPNGLLDAFVARLNSAGSALEYATFLGGAGTDGCQTVAVDSAGRAYVAGWTESPSFPTTPDAFDRSHNGDSDAFVLRLNSAGSSLEFSTFLGGTAWDKATAVAVDAGGRAYAGGYGYSDDFPTTPGAFDRSQNGNRDGFVARLNSTGSGLEYGSYLGGTNGDWVHAIAVDPGNRLTAAGWTESSDFPTAPGAFDASHNGSADAYVVRLDAAGGALQAGTFLGGPGWDGAFGVAVDEAGRASVTGETGSSAFPTTPGAFDRSFNGGTDAFATRLNAAGSALDLATLFGGAGNDQGWGIDRDSYGQTLIGGRTASGNLPTTADAVDPTFNGGQDAFLARFDATGSALQYGTYLGGSGDERIIDVFAGEPGLAAAAGETGSSGFPVTSAAYDSTHNGGLDAFGVRLTLPPGTPPGPTATPTSTPTPTPPATATATATPTQTPTWPAGTPTATPPLPAPTATPDFPRCTVAVDKLVYPGTARIDGQIGVTLRLVGDCPGQQVGSAVDVALVIDRSQSMCGDKLAQAQAGGQAFLDAMRLPPDQASVISFAGSANLHSGLTTSRSQAANALVNITCGGVSRIDAGLTRAFDEMSGPRRVAGHTPAVILLTDGNPEGTYADAVRAAAQSLHHAGIQLFTVGLGADANAALLREIATAPDHYYQSPAPADLAQIYGRLAGELRMTPAFNVRLSDVVATQFQIVPGSFSGAAAPDVAGQSLTWSIARLQEGANEVSFRVRPSQCGAFAVSQGATASYDDNRGVRHTVAFPAPTVTVTGCGGGAGDVFVRDNAGDTGVVASSPPWWDSPDIWVRHAQDGGLQHQNPQAGQRNFVYVRVQNRSAVTVSDIDVTVYYGLSGLGLGWPGSWIAMPGAPPRIASLAPGASAVVSIAWDVPNIAGHFCLRGHISAPLDPIVDYRIPWENNIAQRNLHVVAFPQPPAGQCRLPDGQPQQDLFSFDVINTLQSPTSVDLVITAQGLPAGGQLWLHPQALAGRWTSLDGLAVEPDGRLRLLRFPAAVYGIALAPQQQTSVRLEVLASANSPFSVTLSEMVRGNLVGGNTYQRVLPPCLTYLPQVQRSTDVCPGGRIYTNDADFDLGLLINVNHNAPNNNQLQLNDAVTPLPFIWIPLSGRGTIAKVNTENGQILGEYLSAPQGRSRNPSRSTVDLNGNVWVGNRDENSGGKGSIVRIGLAENFQCIDRNGNGQIDTSTGLGDVKPWPNLGGVDNNGGVSSAQDECIITYLRTNGSNVRTLAVDANNNVWAGGYGNRVHDLIDGITGATLRTITPACGGYGGLVDSYGVLWSAYHPYSLLRFDPATNSSQCISMAGSYGLGVDNNNIIWHTQFNYSRVSRIDPAGVVLSTVSTHGNDSRGVTITDDNHVWIANSRSNTVTRLSNDGALVATIPVGAMPTGVAVDASGKVWVTNNNSNNAMRIDPTTNSVDLTVALGSNASPYTYSDMTGSVILGSPPRGKWIVVHDSGAAGTAWGTVRWAQQTPPNTSLAVRVRSAESPVALGSQPWVAVASNVPFGNVPPGRYLQVEVQFTGTDQGATPILYDLTVAARCTP
jgi:streptogramin lyase/uncharacterized protein YegL